MARRYTSKEAAAKMGYSYSYFLKLVRDGCFQYHRISERKIYFTDEDIEKSLQGSLVLKKNEAQGEA